MQDLQNLSAVTLHALAADAMHLAQPFEGARRVPRQLQGLAVVEENVGRHSLGAGGVSAPGEQAAIAGAFGLIEVGEKTLEGRPVGLRLGRLLVFRREPVGALPGSLR